MGRAAFGFLSTTAYAFIPLLMAHGALLSGFLANRILHLGERLIDFKLEILILVVFLLFLVEAPLLVFAPQLAQAKRAGAREFGALAQRYVREFDDKWMRGKKQDGEQLVGSADIQSLADMGASHELVRSMRALLVSRDGLLTLGACVVLPLAPLLLTMMPVEELLTRLVGIIF